MAWAAPGDVALFTGITPTTAEVAQAQGVIELLADVTEDASDAGNISPKNLRLLKQAVSYQAAWINQHPDAFTGMDTTKVSQDGVSADWAHANAQILAPLAKRCIDRLSWKRIRSLRIGRRSDPRNRSRTMNVTSAVMDDRDPRWRPLDAGGGHR